MKKYKLVCLLLSLILIVNIVNLCINIKTASNSHNCETLNNIKIGVTKSYVDKLIGTPLTSDKRSLYHYKEKGKIFTAAGYKYSETPVLCLYENNTLVAFAVVVNEKNEYKVTRKFYLEEDKFLKDFTYYDFCEYASEYYASVPISNIDATYYYEIHRGDESTNNIASFLASYMYFDDNNILHVGQDSIIETDDPEKMTDELKEERKKAKPNMYGEIHPDYADNFFFLSDLLTYNDESILFER